MQGVDGVLKGCIMSRVLRDIEEADLNSADEIQLTPAVCALHPQHTESVLGLLHSGRQDSPRRTCLNVVMLVQQLANVIRETARDARWIRSSGPSHLDYLDTPIQLCAGPLCDPSPTLRLEIVHISR